MTAVLTPNILIYDIWAKRCRMKLINISHRVYEDFEGEQYAPITHNTDLNGRRFKCFEILPEFTCYPKCDEIIENVKKRIF